MPKSKKVESVPITKDTRDAIAFFNGKKTAVDIIKPAGDRTFKFAPHMDTLNDKFFNWIDGKGHYIVLGLTVAAVVAVVYWMMHQ